MNGLNSVRKVGVLEGEDRIGNPYSYLQIAQAALFQDVKFDRPKVNFKIEASPGLVDIGEVPAQGSVIPAALAGTRYDPEAWRHDTYTVM